MYLLRAAAGPLADGLDVLLLALLSSLASELPSEATGLASSIRPVSGWTDIRDIRIILIAGAQRSQSWRLWNAHFEGDQGQNDANRQLSQ